jgi:hypothetical protein
MSFLFCFQADKDQLNKTLFLLFAAIDKWMFCIVFDFKNLVPYVGFKPIFIFQDT